MEAENGSSIMNTPKIIRWDGDWNQFKRLFKATARLNGGQLHTIQFRSLSRF